MQCRDKSNDDSYCHISDYNCCLEHVFEILNNLWMCIFNLQVPVQAVKEHLLKEGIEVRI